MAAKKQTGKKGKPASEYDSAWKDIIEMHFEPFLEFFFPDIHRDIDFVKGYEFLSKELRKIAPDANIGKRFADVLVKVHLKDGSETCICVFIHIEVQGQKEPGFIERIYVYNYRIFDKFREQGVAVVSLAVLTDEDENYRPDEYLFKRWGFEHRMKIPLAKTIDYRNKKELTDKLEASLNPMAMVVRAQLKSGDARRVGDDERAAIKKELIRECYRRRYKDGDMIRSLLRFLDFIIRLPEELEKKLSEEISVLEEEIKMPYVTSWERIAKKEGIKEGEIKGKRKGKLEGKREGKLETARVLVKEGIDLDIIAGATGFPKKEIEKLAETVH